MHKERLFMSHQEMVQALWFVRKEQKKKERAWQQELSDVRMYDNKKKYERK